MPLNATRVAPVKFVPVIVTAVPPQPLVGLKLVIVGVGPDDGEVAGAGRRCRWASVTADRARSSRPPGTVVLICVLEATVKVARGAVEAQRAVAPREVRARDRHRCPRPAPLAGLKLVIVGVPGRR